MKFPCAQASKDWLVVEELEDRNMMFVGMYQGGTYSGCMSLSVDEAKRLSAVLGSFVEDHTGQAVTATKADSNG